MIFWNKDILEDTPGLDILGVRAIDQGIEANLVNGVTTVSARGRYFSILPWAIDQYYKMADGQYVESAFYCFLTRVEFLINAACEVDKKRAGGAILGSTFYSKAMRKMRSGESVELPSEATSSRILNVYLNPCKSVGLLDDGASADGVPYRLTERGRAIWQARANLLGASPLNDLLFRKDGKIDAEIAASAVDAFSLGALSPDLEEARLLRTAFSTPWQTGARQQVVNERYSRFNQTIGWIESFADGEPVSANRMLARNLEACTIGTRTDEASLKWAEYEWLRRQHYALELMLSSACGALAAMNGEGSPEEIIASVEEHTKENTGLEDIWPEAKAAWKKSAREAVRSVPDDIMRGIPTDRNKQLNPYQKMLMAFALIASLEQQTRNFRSEEPRGPVGNASDLALKLVVEAGESSFQDLLKMVMRDCALLPHLQTTYRKIGNGQKSSLRFFLDGERLRLTRIASGAGFSNSRLNNTLEILTDTGLLARAENGAIAKVAA